MRLYLVAGPECSGKTFSIIGRKPPRGGVHYFTLTGEPGGIAAKHGFRIGDRIPPYKGTRVNSRGKPTPRHDGSAILLIGQKGLQYGWSMDGHADTLGYTERYLTALERGPLITDSRVATHKAIPGVTAAGHEFIPFVIRTPIELRTQFKVERSGDPEAVASGYDYDKEIDRLLHLTDTVYEVNHYEAQDVIESVLIDRGDL